MQILAHSHEALFRRGVEFLSSGVSPVLVLAATRAAADDLVRSACPQAGGALAGVYRHSIRDLVFALSAQPMAALGLTPVHRVAREAIAAGIAA